MNELIITKPPKLRSGQLALYVLFCNSVKEKRVLQRKEIFDLYKEYVAEGQSDKYVYTGDGTNKGVWEVTDWDEWEWKRNFEQWFVYTLGALLKKGYLRVVPAINLSECDMGQLENKKEREKGETN